MSKFKVGDKVRLKDDFEDEYAYVKKGEIYEVTVVGTITMGLKGVWKEQTGYIMNNFELVQQPKTMYCIANYLKAIEITVKNFTVGKQYEIIREYSSCYTVKDDNGSLSFNVPKYFFSEQKPEEKCCNNCEHSGILHKDCNSCDKNHINFTPKQPISTTPKTYNLIFVNPINSPKTFLCEILENISINKDENIFVTDFEDKFVATTITNSFEVDGKTFEALKAVRIYPNKNLLRVTGMAIKQEKYKEETFK